MKAPVVGHPDPAYISTGFAERQDRTLRLRMRRFAGLADGFSKELANLEAAVALHCMHYDLVRGHRSLRITPAMAAGADRRLWPIGDNVGLID